MPKPGLTNNENPYGHHSLAKGILGILFSPLVAAIVLIGCAAVNLVAAGAKLAGKKRIADKIDEWLLKEGPLAFFVEYMRYSLNNLNKPKSNGSALPRYVITQAPEEDQGADVTANYQTNPLTEHQSFGDDTTIPATTVDATCVTGLRNRRGYPSSRS